MQMFDLGRFVGGSGFNLPEFNLPDLPDAWRIGHGGGTGFGLGPFALPIDWPEIDWPLTLSNPFEGLLDFFRRLFTGSFIHWRTFRTSCSSMDMGSTHGGLPDLRLPDLGWGSDGGFGWGVLILVTLIGVI